MLRWYGPRHLKPDSVSGPGEALVSCSGSVERGSEVPPGFQEGAREECGSHTRPVQVLMFNSGSWTWHVHADHETHLGLTITALGRLGGVSLGLGPEPRCKEGCPGQGGAGAHPGHRTCGGTRARLSWTWPWRWGEHGTLAAWAPPGRSSKSTGCGSLCSLPPSPTACPGLRFLLHLLALQLPVEVDGRLTPGSQPQVLQDPTRSHGQPLPLLLDFS